MKGKQSTIGMEYELMLINSDGTVANNADSILQDDMNDGSFTRESKYCQVEINSSTASTIMELHEDVLKRLFLLEKVARKYDVQPVSASEFGASEGRSRGTVGRPMEAMYINMLGEDMNEALNTISGIHLHFDQDSERLLDQYRMFLALDPLSYAVSSTSPIRYDGVNGRSCHRINIVRNQVFDRFPLHGKLLVYPASVDELQQLDKQRFLEWLDASGDPESFMKLFSHDDGSPNYNKTNFTPIRKRDEIGNGTWEIRSLDTTPLNIALSVAALYKGCNDRLVRDGAEVSVSDSPDEYHFGPQSVVLPAFSDVKVLEQSSVNSGLKSDDIRRYLGAVLTYAESALPQEDLQYLDPIRQALDRDSPLYRINPADQIMGYLRSNGPVTYRLSPDQRTNANRFARELFLRGMEVPI
jgi:hypothetical protein